jgi:O-antigen/teichoic acid export membrane protein
MSRDTLVARNATFLGIAQVVSWVTSLAYLVVVPRLVGPSQWGEMGAGLAITALAGAIAGMGLSTVVIKEVARHRARAAEYVAAALAARMLLAIPFAIGVAVPMLAHGYSTRTRIMIGMLGMSALVNFLVGPVSAALQGLEQMRYTALASMISGAADSLTAVGIVLFITRDVIALGPVSFATALLSAGLLVFWLRRSIPPRPRFNWPLMRSLITGGLPYWGTGLFVMIYTWVDGLMLSLMDTTTVVGWYAVATRLVTNLLFLPTILATALFPAAAHAFAQDRTAANVLLRRGFRLQTNLSLPLAAGAVLLGPSAVTLLFGPSYARAGPVVAVLALTLIPTYINMFAGQALAAMDRQSAWTRVMGVMCLVNPAINLVTIPLGRRLAGNGALGAAWALLATELLVTLAALVLLPRGLLGWATLRLAGRAAAATAVMAGAVWLLRERFVVLPIGAGALVFFAMAVPLRAFAPEDMRLAAEGAGKVLSRLGPRRPADRRARRVKTARGGRLGALSPTASTAATIGPPTPVPG